MNDYQRLSAGVNRLHRGVDRPNHELEVGLDVAQLPTIPSNGATDMNLALRYILAVTLMLALAGPAGANGAPLETFGGPKGKVKISGLFAQHATAPGGRITKGNGVIKFTEGHLERDGDMVRLSWRPGLSRFLPLKNLGAITLKGRVVEESASGLKIDFQNSNANRAAVPHQDGYEPTDLSGSLAVEKAKTGAARNVAKFQMSMGINVPGYGSTKITTNQTGDDVTIR